MDEKTIIYLLIAIASMVFSARNKKKKKQASPSDSQNQEMPQWLQDLMQAGEQQIKKRVVRVDPKPAEEATQKQTVSTHKPYVRQKIKDKAPTKTPHKARVSESRMKKAQSPEIGSTQKKRKRRTINLKQAVIHQTILNRPEY